MSRTATPPRVTVIYPGFDVRGHAAEHLRAWTGEQTLPRDRYRVIAVLTPESDEESAVRAELGPDDKLVHERVYSDTAMWNAGAAVAETPWLILTEGHCPPHPDCLAALDRWLEKNPEARAGNFAITHPDDYLMAKISDRWFGEQISKWDDDWPRLHRAGFAIRRDIFEHLGGFQHFGQFGPPLLSAKFHAAGYKMEVVPGAAVTHIDDRDLYGHHFDTIDFVRGECAAREAEDPAFFEKYFGHSSTWRNWLTTDPNRAREMLAAVARFSIARRQRPPCAIALLRDLLRRTLTSSESRVAFGEATTLLEESTLLHLPLPKEKRYEWFVRAHRRVVDTAVEKWVVGRLSVTAKGIPHGLHKVSELDPWTHGGVHAIESYGERNFRWSEPFVLFQLPGDEPVNEVRIETGNLRRDRKFGVRLAACGNRPLPSRCIRMEKDGTLVITIPEKFRSHAAESGLSLLIDPLPPADRDSPEARQLGLPIFSVGIT